MKTTEDWPKIVAEKDKKISELGRVATTPMRRFLVNFAPLRVGLS